MKKILDTWELIDAVIAKANRVLLYGPPGTGKSYAASHCSVNGQPVYIVSLTDETPAAELRGHYVPKDGNFVWQDGPCLLAWRNGGRLVINEVQRAGADALGFLAAILEDSDVVGITLPTGEFVKPAPGFSVVATMNGSPNDFLDEAIRSRFPVSIQVTEIHPSALAQLPEDLRKPAADSTVAEPERRISIRSWSTYASLRDALGPVNAATAVFGPSANDVLNTLKIART
jgi:MoxR-like ATPase